MRCPYTAVGTPKGQHERKERLSVVWRNGPIDPKSCIRYLGTSTATVNG